MRLSIIGILFLLFSCNTTHDSIPHPKKIKGQVHVDNYWGTEIKDYYRNLENAKDSVVQDWYKSQGDYATNILKNIIGIDSLAKQMHEFSSRKTYRVRKTNITNNGQYFFLKKMSNEKKFKLYYKKSYNQTDELIFDPATFKQNSGKSYVINYIRPSWNGKYVVAALTYKGREVAEMVIIDMETKKTLPQIIGSCWPSSFYGVDWLPDNSGFTYLHFPNINKENKKSKANTESVLYKIGQDPSKIVPVFSPKNNPELQLDKTSYPIIDIKNQNQKYAIAFMVNVNNYFDAYYTNINDLGKENVKWKPLFKKEDKVYRTSYYIKDDVITFKSGKEASNFFIGETNFDLLNFKQPKILIKEKDNEVIKDFKIMPQGIFYTTLKNGVEAKLYSYKKNEEEIKLPRESGNINLKTHNGIDLFVTIRGWLNKSERYLYNQQKGFTYVPYAPPVDYPEFKDFAIKEIEAPSHDGALVPLSIIYNKNIKLNGKNPVFIYGYGAYGDIESPAFSPTFLTWVLKGGIFCIVHVRGGGEKGDAWHKAGMKVNKPNTWKDLIACTEYLIKEKYSSSQHIAVWSSSAGGIMAGRAMTERPDLFKAVIIDVGILNPIRREESLGGSNYKEYGSIKDSIESKGLIEMDSYHHIREGEKYPATLIKAGMNDPLVAPWQSGKFAARLQEVNKSNNPIVFDVDYDSGHGRSTTVAKVYQDWAAKFSFALWQTGHPDFQLNEDALKKNAGIMQ